MYQPMTDLMRQCQDSITECMEAMLVELKRDHSLVSETQKTGYALALTAESGPRGPECAQRPIQELRHDGTDEAQAGLASSWREDADSRRRSHRITELAHVSGL